MTRVAVAPGMIVWALERSAKTSSSLRARFPRLDRWVEGEQQPTLRQLESFAQATSTPLGLLFLSSPPQETLPIPFYRTLGDEDVVRPSPDLLETVQAMMRRQSWMREYMTDEGLPELPFVGSARGVDSASLLAEKMRSTLHIDSKWARYLSTWTDALRALREAMDSAGILVVTNGVVGNNTHRVLNPKEFRGFVLVDEFAPLVFVNGADAKAAQMFTLAHEFAHVLVGSSAAFDLRLMHPSNNSVERICNQAAAEFLVPESELRDLWPSVRHNARPYEQIAHIFKVSAIVAARRALDTDLVSQEDFTCFYAEYVQDAERRRSVARDGGSFYANQRLRLGHRFSAAVVRASKEGKLLYSEAYRLTGLYGSTFERYAAQLMEKSR